MTLDARPCLIIAEAGVNHGGDLNVAKRMAEVARECGADGVKYQTFNSETLVSVGARKAAYQEMGADPNESQLEMLQSLELSFAEFEDLSNYCELVGIEFLSTPFDEDSADFLNRLGMSRFKIPSGEITNVDLIQRIASFGKPIILSTGMSNLEEVERAVGWIREKSPAELCVLHCISNYPAKPSEMNLLAMGAMREALSVPVGLSDHTLGIEIALAATALGASCIEKHFTLDRNLSGPDHAASLNPRELAEMVQGIRLVESALGNGEKIPAESERDVALVARRSIVASRDLPLGTKLERDDLEFKRPGSGIEPWRYEELLGRSLKVDLQRDALFGWEMVE